MITEDGKLSYQVEPQPNRLFANHLRHVVNPVVGVICGLVGGAALFLLAVQQLFGVRPSPVALAVLLAGIAVYLAAAIHARLASRRRGAYRVVLNDRGVTESGAGAAAGGHPWARLTRWLESDEDFVVASTGWRDRVAITLPKASIPEDEHALVREVLHAYIDPHDESISEAFAEMGWDEQPPRRTNRSSE